MGLATLFFSGREWGVPAAALVGVALILLLWSYRSAPADQGIRTACFLLKLLGFATLALCLLEPFWADQRAKPGANMFAIVADNSQGMQIHDRGQPLSRGETLRQLLNADRTGWQATIDEQYQVRRYVFDARLQPTEQFAELVFDGRATSLGAALHTLSERFKGRPLAGVLLFTDGNATDLVGALPDLSGLPPIYPVVMGNDDPIKDVAIQNVTISQTAFEDAPVSIQADVTATGYPGAKIVAQLLDPSGKKLEEQTLGALKDGEPLAFRFQMRPEKSGVSFYRLRVSAAGEREQFTNPKISQEATLANNSRVLVVDRGRGPYRILYVSGRPNWEYKFLHRALEEDDQIQLVGLIRIAKREPRFDFRGRVGESSNPLFRGFGNQSKEEVERYDQPVLIRLNTRDAGELSGGFPKTAEELYSYDAVLLDDLEAEFFTSDQMLLLQRFVSERGGGFLMLGGMESLQQGKYQRTPIGDLLPVYLDHVAEGKPPTKLRLALTREGWLQPWARLRKNEVDEKSRLENMPPFLVLNPVRDIKPGASLIATATDEAGITYPALVMQRFGHGRSAALTLGDLWHWGLRDAESHRDMDKAWRQMIRWLVADVPHRIELAAEHLRGDPNQPVQLQVRVRDAKYQPLDNVAVTLKIQPLANGATNGITLRLNAEPALNEPGLYQAAYVPRDTGGYLAVATVTNAVGAEVGRAEIGWATDLAAEEFRSLKPNRALLEEIARKSGGEIITAAKLPEFARHLPRRQAPVTESYSSPLWHTSTVFLFALVCFIAEWGLRRRKGMA